MTELQLFGRLLVNGLFPRYTPTYTLLNGDSCILFGALPFVLKGACALTMWLRSLHTLPHVLAAAAVFLAAIISVSAVSYLCTGEPGCTRNSYLSLLMGRSIA
jgi:hypothetical protein